jgi:uncharacterized protein
MKKNQYSKHSAFINRHKEFEFLKEWLKEEPHEVLFVYGPKSSGKTTLLYKFFQEISILKNYNIKFFNFREIFVEDYNHFIKVFFQQYESESEKEIKSTQQYDFKFFKVSSETKRKIEKFESDPFSVMKKEILELWKKEIRPVILIDELQALSGIFINGNRDLIKELFNLFVALTKESNLCHIIICSSDGFFIEKVYNFSKMLKTSRFFEIDYLEKDDILYWMNNLEKESGIKDLILTEHQIDRIWHYFGGSIWEIDKFLSTLRMNTVNSLISDEILEKEALKDVHTYYIEFQEYVLMSRFKEKLLEAAFKLFGKNGSFIFNDISKLGFTQENEKDLVDELAILVQNNLFSYSPVTGEYKPQGNSVMLGLEKYCKLATTAGVD